MLITSPQARFCTWTMWLNHGVIVHQPSPICQLAQDELATCPALWYNVEYYTMTWQGEQ